MSKIFFPVLFLILAYFLQNLLPWYGILLLALICTLFYEDRSVRVFLVYFVLGFVVWYGFSLRNDLHSGGALASKIAVLFGRLPRQVLLIITGLVGGITAGLGGFTGNAIKQIVGGK